MPLDKAIEYAEFIKGIFYSGKIDMLLKRYENVRVNDILNAKYEILKKGFDAISVNWYEPVLDDVEEKIYIRDLYRRD